MTYPAKHYAEALYGALEGKTGEERAAIIKRFALVIEREKARSKLSQILAHYERIFLSKQGMRKVDVESVSPLSKEIRIELEKSLGGKILLTETLNPKLIAGMTVLIDDSIFIDATAQKQISNLFR